MLCRNRILHFLRSKGLRSKGQRSKAASFAIFSTIKVIAIPLAQNLKQLYKEGKSGVLRSTRKLSSVKSVSWLVRFARFCVEILYMRVVIKLGLAIYALK